MNQTYCGKGVQVKLKNNNLCAITRTAMQVGRK